MSVIIKGNASAAVDYTAASIAVSAPTKYWCGGRFRMSNFTLISGSMALMRWGPANSGAALTLQAVGASNIFRPGSRLNVNGTSSNATAPTTPVTLNQWYEWLTVVDYDVGYIRHYIGGVKVYELLREPETTWTWHSFPTAAIIPRINGSTTEGLDFEISHFVGCLGATITELEAESFSFADDDLGDLSAPPTFGVIPTGEIGAHAAALEDMFGTNDMTQVAGPVPPAENYPILTGGASETVLSNPSAVATARNVTISADTSVSDGTAYIVLDEASNFTVEPSIPEIVAGTLDDGTTPAAFSRSVSLSEETSLSELFTVGKANTQYLAYIVQDTDDSGDYSNVISVSIETKRPVIKPAGNSTWLSANNSPLINESGMTWTVLGTAHTGTGLSTDSSATGEIDLTGYVNSGANKDIGDTINVDVTRTNGEVLAVRGATIIDGDA